MVLYGRRRLIIDSGSIDGVADKLATRPDLSASFHSTSTSGPIPLPNGCVFCHIDLEDIDHHATVHLRVNDAVTYIKDVDWIVEPNYPIAPDGVFPPDGI